MPKQVLASAAFVAGAFILLVDLVSPTIRVGPLEIIPIVLIALWTSERIALYAALTLAALNVAFGHLLGTRPIGLIPIANGVILALSYAVALVIVGSARRLGQQMTTLTQEAADAKRVHDALFQQTVEAGSSWEVDVIHLPLHGVGGDYFHVRRVPGGTMAFIADVSGKGIQAAMLLAALKTHCEATAHSRVEPRAALATYNRALQGFASDMFATAWLAVLDDDGRVRYASAGHEPAVIRRSDGTLQPLLGGGLPLGVEADGAAVEHVVMLAPGDTLVAYTDGFSYLFERHALPIDDLFTRFAEVRHELPSLERRDDMLAVRIAYWGMGNVPQAQHPTLP